jgi:hypothetical protein
MVAHANSFNATATMASSTTTRRTPTLFAALAPRSSSRNTKTGSVNKARTERRCVEVIGRKMDELRRLVPSDSGDDDETDDGGIDELLFRAADYIVRLQAQVKAMQLMVDVLEEHTKDF